jgi:hypothetical protein
MEFPRCPITLDFMRDPVTDCNGHTFERSAIESWYATHDTSPVTGAVVANKTLVVNYALKQLMDTSVKSAEPSVAPAVAAAVSMLEPARLPELITTTSMFKCLNKTYLHVHLECNPRQEFSRKPITCITVIDTSGSMGERATPYNPSGENDGFSRLDLVKHSLATIYKSLSAGDKLAIITFNSVAELLLPACDVSNYQTIHAKIGSMQAGGNTNIWAGLKMAIDIANQVDKMQSSVSILLLTDGVSNANPPRGILPTFSNYYTPGKYPIHTFAYGYEVDSATLVEIAKQSQGVFGFIPDGTMVGTIFINAMSAMLATVYNDITLEFGCDNYIFNNSDINSDINKNKNVNTQDIIHVGTILHGQSRNIILEYNPINKITYFKLSYNDQYYIEPVGAARIIYNLEEVQSQLARIEIMKLISKKAGETLNTHELKQFITKYSRYASSNLFIKDLLTDCYDNDPNKGQIGKAIERPDWYRKWGCHYLPSLESAYRLELCLNFKDLAPQHYAGGVFKSELSRIETIFSNIKPPTPSISQSGCYAYQGSQISSISHATIPQSYYNVSGGCFTDSWLVMMYDGSKKLVRNIRAGDIVVSNDSPTGYARVTCVVRLAISSTLCMISPDGINGITAYHPVWLSNDETRNWKFPEQITDKFIVARKGEYMYDFVIDSGYSISFVGGINIACLGHGCKDNEVIRHDYFGTHKVIDDLKDHEGWFDGYIILDTWQFIRDSSNRVVKLEF